MLFFFRSIDLTFVDMAKKTLNLMYLDFLVIMTDNNCRCCHIRDLHCLDDINHSVDLSLEVNEKKSSDSLSHMGKSMVFGLPILSV